MPVRATTATTPRPARKKAKSLAMRGSGVVLVLTLLAGCKGAEVSSDLGQIFGPAPTPGGSGVLASYYVPSFAPYESAAARLRNSVSRYVIQNSTWHRPSNPSVEYESYPLAAARIEYAHSTGLTGKGQTVAIIDEGFRLTHEAFAGKTITRTGTPDVASHGTSVASVLAGSSGTMIGVAPGASLHVADYTDTAVMAQATLRALAIGAVAQNNSWSYDSLAATGANFSYVFNDGNNATTSDDEAYLNALRAYAAEGVVVFAVSNTNHGQSRLMDALPSFDASLEAGWLAVGNAVATFDNDTIHSAQLISSPCYQSARWCLVADGTWTSATSGSNTSYGFGTGSSYATPQVSGALALLAEAFPNLTPHDLRIRLLASANNSFFTPDGTIELADGYFHDYSTEFGHGFLDLRAALLPIGATTMTTGTGDIIATDDAAFRTGSAMGDAVARSLSDVSIPVTDSLKAGFDMPATALVATASPAPLSAGLVGRTLSTDLAMTRQAPPTALTDSFRAHNGQTIEVPLADGSASASILMPGAGKGGGIALKQSLGDGATRLDLGIKVATDAGAVVGFGSADDGAPRSDMMALQLGLSQDLSGGGFLTLGGEMGVADIGTPTAFSAVSTARFDSLSLEIGQKNAFAKGDRLALGVSMPLAVSGGEAMLAMPTTMATNMAEGASPRAMAIDLAPTDRQMDFAVSYQTPLGDHQELSMKLLHAENYGNIAGNTDTAAVMAYTIRF
ncbi:MAG: S8 family peptidase [Paracoccaceae bacterium]